MLKSKNNKKNNNKKRLQSKKIQKGGMKCSHCGLDSNPERITSDPVLRQLNTLLHNPIEPRSISQEQTSTETQLANVLTVPITTAIRQASGATEYYSDLGLADPAELAELSDEEEDLEEQIRLTIENRNRKKLRKSEITFISYLLESGIKKEIDKGFFFFFLMLYLEYLNCYGKIKKHTINENKISKTLDKYMYNIMDANEYIHNNCNNEPYVNETHLIEIRKLLFKPVDLVTD